MYATLFPGSLFSGLIAIWGCNGRNIRVAHCFGDNFLGGLAIENTQNTLEESTLKPRHEVVINASDYCHAVDLPKFGSSRANRCTSNRCKIMFLLSSIRNLQCFTHLNKICQGLLHGFK